MLQRGLALGAILLSVMLSPVVSDASTGGVVGEPLKGKAIKNAVIGKRIYLAVPFGGELPLYYKKDGVVDGSGEAVGLGKFLAPTDQGRWWEKTIVSANNGKVGMRPKCFASPSKRFLMIKSSGVAMTAKKASPASATDLPHSAALDAGLFGCVVQLA